MVKKCCSVEGNRPLGRPCCGWENSIEMKHKILRCESVTVYIPDSRVQWQGAVSTVMNLELRKCWGFL